MRRAPRPGDPNDPRYRQVGRPMEYPEDAVWVSLRLSPKAVERLKRAANKTPFAKYLARLLEQIAADL